MFQVKITQTFIQVLKETRYSKLKIGYIKKYINSMGCNCNGTGWIPIDDEYTGDRTWQLCRECNNPQNNPKPMDANCRCCTCGGIGWEPPNDYQPWRVCSECENRCNFRRPVCEYCYGIGWDHIQNETNGYRMVCLSRV